MKIRFKIYNSLIILLILCFALGIVLISAYKISQDEIQRQIGISEQLNTNSKKTESQPNQNASRQIIKYELPHPGILPDNPLYWIKMVRDRMLLVLTKDSLEKVNLILLNSDKRLKAAEILIKKGKIQLGITTITKAEKYLEQASLLLKKLAKSGEISNEMQLKLRIATLKHEEVLNELSKLVPEADKQGIQNSFDKNKQIKEINFSY